LPLALSWRWHFDRYFVSRMCMVFVCVCVNMCYGSTDRFYQTVAIKMNRHTGRVSL